MHAVKLLHNLFDIACHKIDKRLRKTLFSAAEALTRCQQLSICALGRSLNRSAQVKHTIKCMDRLFGNKKLHKSGHVFYRKITQLLLKNNQRPVILVDWSRLTPCGTFHFLSAHIAIQGRSLPLYSQVYPLKQYSAPKTHREFLQKLKTFLPETCRPIIVTDAGFRNSWFKGVLEMGWHFVGRVRNRTHYCPINQTAWLPIKSLYNQATTSARYIGHVLLCCRFPLSCHFYMIKKPKKYRIKKNLAGKKVQSKASKQHEKGANEPWLLVSSLSSEEIKAVEVIRIYEKRMQIEESFRDLKNTQNGLGLRYCRSFTAARLNVALLIAAFAMLLLWIFGIAAKNNHLHYSFQTNTEKRKTVLSNFMIGWQVLRRKEHTFIKNDLQKALEYIIQATAMASWEKTSE